MSFDSFYLSSRFQFHFFQNILLTLRLQQKSMLSHVDVGLIKLVLRGYKFRTVIHPGFLIKLPMSSSLNITRDPFWCSATAVQLCLLQISLICNLIILLKSALYWTIALGLVDLRDLTRVISKVDYLRSRSWLPLPVYCRNLQKSGCGSGFKIELRLVLASSD